MADYSPDHMVDENEEVSLNDVMHILLEQGVRADKRVDEIKLLLSEQGDHLMNEMSELEARLGSHLVQTLELCSQLKPFLTDAIRSGKRAFLVNERLVTGEEQPILVSSHLRLMSLCLFQWSHGIFRDLEAVWSLLKIMCLNLKILFLGSQRLG
ncbi:hypothetical protein CHUAL_001641 [Chamberlinius hualienensis]